MTWAGRSSGNELSLTSAGQAERRAGRRRADERELAGPQVERLVAHRAARPHVQDGEMSRSVYIAARTIPSATIAA